MRFEVDIPDSVSQQLAERATATGDNVVNLIQVAVAEFVQSRASLPGHRRRPDLPLETYEMSAPCDLTRSRSRWPVAVEVSPSSRRRPDPCTFSE
jgi:hypothetical protein